MLKEYEGRNTGTPAYPALFDTYILSTALGTTPARGSARTHGPTCTSESTSTLMEGSSDYNRLILSHHKS